MPLLAMVCVQKEISRGVSLTPRPTRLLNHWRRSSTSEISAIGVPHRRAASTVKSSNWSSSGVSRIS